MPSSLSAQGPSLSIPALDAFQRHLTPLNSTPISSLVWTFDPQIADVQDDFDTKREHLSQLRTIMRRYLLSGDDALVPIMASLAGFTREAAGDLLTSREAYLNRGLGGLTRRFTGFGARLGGQARSISQIGRAHV